MRLAIYMNDECWRKKLLRFVTGSFTLPRGGLLKKISVKTQGVGQVDLLPRASTCTLALYLPPYPTREAFAEKLDTALDNTAGFWLA
jgi:hypothetical protein